jgi:hypothetical protein
MRLLSRSIGAVLVVAILSWVIIATGSVHFWFDLPTILIAVVLTPAILLMSFGFGLTARAIRAGVAGKTIDDPATLGQYLRVLERGHSIAWMVGLMMMVMHVIAMTANMSEPSSIGASIAYACLQMFWPLVLAECVFAPLRDALATSSHRAYVELAPASRPLTMTSVGFGIATIILIATITWLGWFACAEPDSNFALDNEPGLNESIRKLEETARLKADPQTTDDATPAP